MKSCYKQVKIAPLWLCTTYTILRLTSHPRIRWISDLKFVSGHEWRLKASTIIMLLKYTSSDISTGASWRKEFPSGWKYRWVWESMSLILPDPIFRPIGVAEIFNKNNFIKRNSDICQFKCLKWSYHTVWQCQGPASQNETNVVFWALWVHTAATLWSLTHWTEVK